MEHDVDDAARRTAINLMRLNEALEMNEAEDLPPHQFLKRVGLLRNFYRRWFTSKAIRRIP